MWAGLGGSVRCASDCRSGGCGFDPRQVDNILSWIVDHDMFSMVILSLPLIQEGRFLRHRRPRRTEGDFQFD